MPTKVDVKLTFAAIAAMPRGERYTLTPAIAFSPSPAFERRIFLTTVFAPRHVPPRPHRGCE